MASNMIPLSGVRGGYEYGGPNFRPGKSIRCYLHSFSSNGYYEWCLTSFGQYPRLHFLHVCRDSICMLRHVNNN